jgi:glycolate oxidase FAD binding subunit
MAKTCLIDGFGPLPVLEPTQVAEISEIVRAAICQDQAVYPVGGRTTLAYGLSPAKPGVIVETQRLNGVIDYPARDMTITVQAGITLGQLDAVLSKENQRLPIDVPQADRATVGGALAVNASGPRRYGFGTLRDYVLGITVVNDEGKEVKAGGRVVKNVAGYDLCKLHVGALGTLGIITQVTLKLRPRPEHQALIAIAVPAKAIESLLMRLHESRIHPVCVELLNDQAIRCLNRKLEKPLPEVEWVVLVGFEDNRAAVEWQVQQLRKELLEAGCQSTDTRSGLEAENLWQALVELSAGQEADLVFKANLLPHACATFCQQAVALPTRWLIQAHAGNGIVIGQTDDKLTLDEAVATVSTLQTAATQAQGNVVILRCPSSWKTVLPIWGVPREDAWLMRAVKEKLDPRQIFNPGRFLAGL